MKIKELKSSLIVFIIMIIIPGFIYPLFMHGVAQLAFSHKANGSLIKIDGRVIGSELLGQKFTGPEYFHCRPSASDYDALNSGGTNYGPTNKKYMNILKNRAAAIRKENNLPENAEIPADIALASASGLDPHISAESAFLQAKRIATERKISESIVRKIIEDNTERRYFNVVGNSYINVLKTNIALYFMDRKKL